MPPPGKDISWEWIKEALPTVKQQETLYLTVIMALSLCFHSIMKTKLNNIVIPYQFVFLMKLQVNMLSNPLSSCTLTSLANDKSFYPTLRGRLANDLHKISRFR